MAKYAVYVFCDACSDVHPMHINVTLNDGPAERESIGNTWAGKAMPPEVARLHHNTVTCLATGQRFVQEDNNQIFLVPVGD